MTYNAKSGEEAAKGLRPAFLEELSQAYNLQRKNIVMLTGDINGLFWTAKGKGFLALEQFLHTELKEKFNMIRMDIASGISFFDKETETEVTRICESIDGVFTPTGRLEALRKMITASRHNPLQALVLLQGIGEAFVRVRRLESNVKPMCIIFQFSGSLFPEGDYSRLTELDRQRLILFLNWVSTPMFRDNPDLLILINNVKTEINSKISALPYCVHQAIDLPSKPERKAFVRFFTAFNPTVECEQGEEKFVEDTAGMSLNHIEDMLELAARLNKAISRQDVVKQVNEILQAQLGDIIRVKYPAHTRADIIGYKETGEIFMNIFERCEDPETAVSAILVSGPNGAGKTFQLEAYAAESGRVVIELAGIRGSYFGETDRFFELLRWHIATFGKILILVDEAHTAFGSVHSDQTHQTEQRLAGNIIKMMGDPRYFGKVLWGLMTSRPDELDPDIKSRAPVQVPIFDLEGEERRTFVADLFKRKNIAVAPENLDQVLALTDYYSARDFRNFAAEVLAQRRRKPNVSILDVLSGWQASKSIKRQREFQEMIAALHCSYPNLLPVKYRGIPDEELMMRVEALKRLLIR